MRASLVYPLFGFECAENWNLYTLFLRDQNEAQRSGFILERRNGEMIRSFRRQPKATGGNGGNEADFDDEHH